MKQNYPLTLLFLIIGYVSFSQVQTTGNWTAIGNTTLSTVTDDADNGDGVGDGAIFVNGLDTATPQGASFTFDGTMTLGESLTIKTYTYNRNVSYVKFTVGLYNASSGAQLAISSEITITNTSSPPVYTTLSYTAVGSDVGDALEVRYYRSTDFEGYRNFAIDNLSLNEGVKPTGNWTAIGDTNLSIVTDDADNGDGVGDGAIYVDGQSAVVGQGVTHTFDGAMSLNETINIETYTYNRTNSFVKFVVELFNSTDNTTLVSSSEITISKSSDNPPPVLTTLNYIALASDVGDVLEIRYIRTDNGNTGRNFVIDNLKLNGTFVSTSLTSATTCPFTITPDLSLIASNATIESEIITAVTRFSDAYLGTSAPSSGALSGAETAYAALNISVSGGSISGNTISNFNSLSFLKTFAQELKYNPGNTTIEAKANNTVWLAGKQFCEGTLSRDNTMYQYDDFARSATLLVDFLQPEVKELFEYTLYVHSDEFDHFWEPTYDTSSGAINTDFIFNVSDALLAYSLWFDTADERYRFMRAYKRYYERFFSYTSGTSDGIKPDGSGFHHWTAYNNYMYAYDTAAEVLSYLSGTSFQVAQSNYEVFRDAVYAQYMQANDDGEQALSTAGRNPQIRRNQFDQANLKGLAIAGGNILGLGTADPILAGMYNRIYGVDGAFGYSTVTPFEEGFIHFNHASAGAFRNNNWVAFNKGFTNNMWGSEIYTSQNRYGRYQSYGALEILYPGNKETGNGYEVDTWDWNYNPGTTVIQLPWANLHAERGRIDEEQQKRFVGSLGFQNKGSSVLNNNFSTYGMFAMDFQELEAQGFGTTHSGEQHNDTFTFKKSNFFFDDFIVCLASGISNNDGSNPTVTTLYQRLDNTASDIVANGTTYSSTGSTTISGANNWFLSNYDTGFYLVSSNDVKIKRELQQNPNQNQIWPVTYTSNASDFYYTGYIDHGTNPSNADYEYMILPNSSTGNLQTLHTAVSGGNKPYTVHQKNATAHIVEHVSKEIFGYALFGSVTGLTYDKVKAVNASCLLMTNYNDTNKILQLSIVDPDIGFSSRSYIASTTKVKNVTLDGEWVLNDTYPGVQILSSNTTETVVQFTLRDGLSKEVLLVDPTTLSVADEILTELIIYPNPTSDLIYINSEEEISEVKVFNVLGQEIDSYNMTFLKGKTIDVSNYTSSVYLMKITIDNKSKTIKFIKE